MLADAGRMAAIIPVFGGLLSKSLQAPAQGVTAVSGARAAEAIGNALTVTQKTVTVTPGKTIVLQAYGDGVRAYNTKIEDIIALADTGKISSSIPGRTTVFRTVEDVNAEMVKSGKTASWDTVNQKYVTERLGTSTDDLYRVYYRSVDGEIKESSWLVTGSELKKYSTPDQIADALALPKGSTPNTIAKLNDPSGLKLQEGLAGKIPDWERNGGAEQVFSLDALIKDDFEYLGNLTDWLKKP